MIDPSQSAELSNLFGTIFTYTHFNELLMGNTLSEALLLLIFMF